MSTASVTYNSKAVRLSEKLLEDFRNGSYVEGTRLPPEADLADQYDISRSTIRKALRILEEDKHVVRIPHKGVVVTSANGKASRVGHIAFIADTLNDQAELFARGLQAGLDPERFLPTVYSVNANLTRLQTVLDNVVSLRPDGMVLRNVPKELCNVDYRRLKAAGIPMVVMGKSIEELQCDRVMHDASDSGRLMGRYILGKGYRNVGVLLQVPRVSSEPMLKRLRHELGQELVEVPDENVMVYDGRSHGYGEFPDPYIDAYEHMARALKKGFRCEVLVCSHDYPAVAALRAILDAGIKVPEEMKVISGSRCLVGGVSPMRLTTVSLEDEEQARIAAELLVRRIDGYEGPPEVHHVTGTLMQGETA